MKCKRFTDQERIYLIESDDSYREKSKKTGRTRAAIQTFLSDWSLYNRGKIESVGKSNLHFFVRYIKGEAKSITTNVFSGSENNSTRDVYKRLQNAVLDVVVYELKEKEAQMKTSYESRIQELEKDKKELQETLRENAKMSNWSYMLRQKMGGA